MGSMATSMLKTVSKTVGCAIVFVAAVAGIGALIVTQTPKIERTGRRCGPEYPPPPTPTPR